MSVNRRKGQTLVETAVTLVAFLVVVLGIVDLANLVFVQQSLASQVREAARWGSLNPRDDAAIRNRVLEAATGSTWLGLKPENVEVSREGSGTPFERLTVSVVNYRYPLISPGLTGLLTASRPVSVTVPVEDRR